MAALVADGVDAALIPFSKIDCKSAQATNKEDLEKISREIERTIGFGKLDATVVEQLRGWIADTVAARLAEVRAAGAWNEPQLRLLLRHVELLVAQGRDAEARTACIEGLQVAGGLVCTLVSGEENDPADVEALFAMFDANGDGLLSKGEYAAYLRGIKVWGSGNYTDDKWDDRWPQECQDMESSAEGVSWAGFRDKLYGEFRKEIAANDLASARLPKGEEMCVFRSVGQGCLGSESDVVLSLKFRLPMTGPMASAEGQLNMVRGLLAARQRVSGSDDVQTLEVESFLATLLDEEETAQEGKAMFDCLIPRMEVRSTLAKFGIAPTTDQTLHTGGARQDRHGDVDSEG